MKLSFYFDVNSWMKKGDDVWAVTNPAAKLPNSTRYRIDVTIPDPAEPDKVIEGKAVEVKE